MTYQTIVIRMNRRWAWWTLGMAVLGVVSSAWLMYTGLRPGRPDPGTGWLLAATSLVGVVAFAYAGWVAVRTIHSPYRLELSPSHLAFFTPAYDLRVPWERVAGIALADVDRRIGCALVFDDVAAVAEGAAFHSASAPKGAVRSAARMQERMEGCFRDTGYHLGIPHRILERGPEALAKLLTQARTGELWQEAAE
jgi:hypothetical protein